MLSQRIVSINLVKIITKLIYKYSTFFEDLRAYLVYTSVKTCCKYVLFTCSMEWIRFILFEFVAETEVEEGQNVESDIYVY